MHDGIELMLYCIVVNELFFVWSELNVLLVATFMSVEDGIDGLSVVFMTAEYHVQFSS